MVYVEEQEGILESLIYVESVSEKKQMQENSQELENRVGRIPGDITDTRDLIKKQEKYLVP